MLLNTTKYDGTLHYRFEVDPMYRGGEVLAVYRGPDVELHSYRGSFIAGGHLLNVFYAKHHHNIAIMWTREWTPRMHYVNVATPALWDHNRVTAADMDLDVIRFAFEDRIILDDEDEFAEHTRTMSYPTDLVSRCLAEAEEMRRRMAARQGLFSDSIFDWRPGTDLAALLG
jgi:protein associated with RNAse G/E